MYVVIGELYFCIKALVFICNKMKTVFWYPNLLLAECPTFRDVTSLTEAFDLPV